MVILEKTIKKNFVNIVSALLVTVLLILLSACSRHPQINSEGPYWKDDDNKSILEPSFEEPSLVWTSVERTTSDQLLELLDLDRNFRKLLGNPEQAKNLNSFDEVPNSSWFTNRHGLPQTHLSIEQILNGQSITTGPDTSQVWEVFRPKSGGATPGFWIEDSRGDQYIIKFDPKENPEMATAAAAMGARYFYACGFNTPQESIVAWRPENLRIRDGATIKDKDGKKRPLTMDDINSILENVNIQADGYIRSLASLNIGNVKGPFMYSGIRKSDPNDWCPHEHRRELRGLYVIGSLINHYDMKDHNSMDVYVGKKDEGYLKHYLMDFGSTFGSDGRNVKIPIKGYANFFDLRDVGVSTLSLGLKSWSWQDAKEAQFSSIGYFESEIFEPHKFDPIIPNPAFEQLTYQDAYWGAKIVMSFSKDDLNALVKVGKFSNPKAEAYLLQTLLERQKKIGKYWFSKVNPLDYPELQFVNNSLEVDFKDLAVEYGLENDEATYHLQILLNGKQILELSSNKISKFILHAEDLSSIFRYSNDNFKSDENRNLYEFRVYTNREQVKYSKPTVFWLNMNSNNNQYAVVGIEHP